MTSRIRPTSVLCLSNRLQAGCHNTRRAAAASVAAMRARCRTRRRASQTIARPQVFVVAACTAPALRGPSRRRSMPSLLRATSLLTRLNAALHCAGGRPAVLPPAVAPTRTAAMSTDAACEVDLCPAAPQRRAVPRQLASRQPSCPVTPRPPPPQVLSSVERHAAVAVLNRPRALNALNTGMVEALFELYRGWEADPAVACILLKASAPCSRRRGVLAAAGCSPSRPPVWPGPWSLRHAGRG